MSLSPGLWIPATRALREIEARLAGLWEKSGYAEVLPPLLLPRATAEESSPEALLARTLTIAPGTGAVALRSDFTAAVASMARARLPALAEPCRLFYRGVVLRQPAAHGTEEVEAFQAGCERICAETAGGDAAGDLEVATLAARTLASLAIDGAVLELGHWGLVGPLVASVPWPPSARADLERALNGKSASAIRDLSARHGSAHGIELLAELLHLGGKPGAVDALQGALDLASVGDAWRALRRLGDSVARAVPEVVVRLEPTDVRHWSYYTGLTVKAFAPGHASVLLSGGRYDALYPSLGRPFAACGFAVHTGRILAGCPASR